MKCHNPSENQQQIAIFFSCLQPRRVLQLRRTESMPTALSAAEMKEAYENEDIMREFGMTSHQHPRQFYKIAYECDDFSYCVFASDSIVDEVKKMNVAERHYLIDGTFKVVPFGAFNQLLIINVEYLEKVGSLW